MPVNTRALRTISNLILDARGSHASIVGTHHSESDPTAYGGLVYDLVGTIATIYDLPPKVADLTDQELGEAALPLLNRVGLSLDTSKKVLEQIGELVNGVFKATVTGIESITEAIDNQQKGTDDALPESSGETAEPASDVPDEQPLPEVAPEPEAPPAADSTEAAPESDTPAPAQTPAPPTDETVPASESESPAPEVAPEPEPEVPQQEPAVPEAASEGEASPAGQEPVSDPLPSPAAPEASSEGAPEGDTAPSADELKPEAKTDDGQAS